MGSRFGGIFTDEPGRDRVKLEEEATKEFWDTFFHAEPMDAIHRELRSSLSEMYGGLESGAPDKRSFPGFQEWMNEYFALSGITSDDRRRFKVLYYVKLSQSRLLSGSGRLNVLVQLRPVGTSKLISSIQSTCPPSTSKYITHERQQCFNIGPSPYEGMILFKEMHASSMKGGDDDVRNNFKDMSSCGSALHEVISFYVDEETNERKMSVNSYRTGPVLAFTKDDLDDFDANLLSRFITLDGTKKKISTVMRPKDFTRKDEQGLAEMTRDHIKIHSLYYMIDMALQSGVTGEPYYGMDMNPVREAASRLGISQERSIERLCEMTRCITICSVVWVMLAASNAKEINLHFFRTLLTHLVITEEMILEALQMLTF